MLRAADAHHVFTPANEPLVRRIFRITLWVKVADSVLQLLGALALYLIPGSTLLAVAQFFTGPEIQEDPNDFIANLVLRAAQSLSVSGRSAGVVFLFSHGAIKLFVVTMVLLEKWWAYPVFMAALVLLIGYQAYQLTIELAPWLLVLTAIDVVALFLAVHEYRLHRHMTVPR